MYTHAQEHTEEDVVNAGMCANMYVCTHISWLV